MLIAMVNEIYFGSDVRGGAHCPPCHPSVVETASGGFVLWALAVGTSQGLLPTGHGDSMPGG